MKKTTDTDKTLASDRKSNVLEMTREKQCYAKHTKRITELSTMALLQERVIHRMMARTIEELAQPERPHLKIIK